MKYRVVYVSEYEWPDKLEDAMTKKINELASEGWRLHSFSQEDRNYAYLIFQKEVHGQNA